MKLDDIFKILGVSFAGLWIFIFSMPFVAFTENVTETVEQCKTRIIQELPNAINNTDEINKAIDQSCNPKRGGFAKINEFAKWIQENLIGWFLVSFILAVFCYIMIALVGAILIFVIKSSQQNNTTYYYTI